MAIIQSGSGPTLLDIDATSKAARVTLYDAAGNPVSNVYAGSYMVRVEIIPTTLTLGTTYFAMRNLGSRRAFFRGAELKVGFAGAAAATRSLYEIRRFTTATPTGGTALTALGKPDSVPASTFSDIRFSPAGLTTTGLVFEDAFHLVGHTNQLTVDHAQDFNFVKEGSELSKLEIAVNKGLCIRANTAIVLGSYLIGSIYWDERT